MLPRKMYLIILLAHNSFGFLLTLNASCCNWSPLGMIEEIITSHNWLKFFFTSTARSIILVAISVGVESLLISFVTVCIMTTSGFGSFFIGGFVKCFISLVLAPGKQFTDTLVNFSFLLIFHFLIPFTMELPIIRAFFLSCLRSMLFI